MFRRALSPSLLEQLLAAGLSGQQAQAVKLYTLVSGAAPGKASGSQVRCGGPRVVAFLSDVSECCTCSRGAAAM